MVSSLSSSFSVWGSRFRLVLVDLSEFSPLVEYSLEWVVRLASQSLSMTRVNSLYFVFFVHWQSEERVVSYLCTRPRYVTRLHLHCIPMPNVGSSHVSPQNLRCALVSSYQLFITIGLLFAAVTVNGTQFIPTAACYQIPIAIQFVWATILGVGLIFLPESPRWMLMKGNDAGALTSLSRLMAAPEDDAEVMQEFEEISIAVRQDAAVNQSSYADCFRNGPGRHGFRMWTVRLFFCASTKVMC